MITISCECGRQFQTRDENVGKRTKCPVCGSPIVVPAPDFGSTDVIPKKTAISPPPWWDPKVRTASTESSPRTGSEEVGTDSGSSSKSSVSSVTPPVSPKSLEKPTDKLIGLARPLILTAIGAGIILMVLGTVWFVGGFGQPSTNPTIVDNPQDPINHDQKEGTGPSNQPLIGRSDPSEESVSKSPDATSGSVKGEGNGLPKAGLRPRLTVIVPAYFYPAGPGLKEWERLIEAASRVPIVAVANPNSGPGESLNTDYGSIIRLASRRGVVVLGYVGTNYAQRPMAEVVADVDRWLAFYPEVGGFFFDAQPSDPKHLDFFDRLRDHVRKKIKKSLVVTNPGTICDEAFANRMTADGFCIFATHTGFEDFRLPKWADRHPPGLFAAIPQQVATLERMRDFIQLSTNRGLGYIYVTDGQSPLAWGRLPSYWDDEVEAIRKANLGEKL